MPRNYSFLLLLCAALAAQKLQAQTTQGNGAVRGSNGQGQPLSDAQAPVQRASLGSPAVVMIVVGCVAALALIAAVAYRRQRTQEPTTPREDPPDVVMSVSTKSIDMDYHQSFDGPETNKNRDSDALSQRPLPSPRPSSAPTSGDVAIAM